jgi:hypothetical protein
MVHGKALIILRNEGRDSYLYGDCHIQTCNSNGKPGNEDAWQYADEMLNCDLSLALPNKVSLEAGDAIWLQVTYEIHYVRGDGWTTDDDVDVYFNKVRVLKKRIAKENRPEKLLLAKTLLNKIVDYCHTFPGDWAVKDLAKLAGMVGMQVEPFLRSTLDMTSQEHIEAIRKKLPEAFPRPIRTGPIKVETNIHGAWRVVPDTTKKMPDKQEVPYL